MPRLLAALVLALGLAACQDAATPTPPTTPPPDAADASVEPGPTPGQPAPAFTLTSATGETHSLADFAGQTVVLEWLNYDCPFVRKYYGSGTMQQLQAQAASDDVVWLAVVSSAPGEQGYFDPDGMVARTTQESGRARAVLLDPDGTVGRAYGALTTPHMFVIAPDGRVVYNGAIDDRPSSDPESLDGARNYVTDALAALRAGRPADPSRTQPYGCSVKYAEG